jgi:hypothetical protein
LKTRGEFEDAGANRNFPTFKSLICLLERLAHEVFIGVKFHKRGVKLNGKAES